MRLSIAETLLPASTLGATGNFTWTQSRVLPSLSGNGTKENTIREGHTSYACADICTRNKIGDSRNQRGGIREKLRSMFDQATVQGRRLEKEKRSFYRCKECGEDVWFNGGISKRIQTKKPIPNEKSGLNRDALMFLAVVGYNNTNNNANYSEDDEDDDEADPTLPPRRSSRDNSFVRVFKTAKRNTIICQ